jgi:hypothetical protein
MYTLTLTPDETVALSSALDRRLREMLEEIVHTDNREFKAVLRTEYESLERVKRQLTACLHFAAA